MGGPDRRRRRAGLDEFMRVHFPRAELVLDFYHAAEQLSELAQALHPADDGAAGELAGRWCHQLKHEGGAAVLTTLAAVDLRGRKASPRAAPPGDRVRAQQLVPDGLPALPGQRLADRQRARGERVQGRGRPTVEGQRHALE